MTDTTPAASSRIGAKDLITLACAIVGAGFVIGGAIRSDGSREQRLLVAESKIDALEQRGDRKDELLAKIDVRTARIEVKLEMMNMGPKR